MSHRLTGDLLRQIMPKLPKAQRELFAPLLERAMIEFDIVTELRVAAFLAQLAHESMELTRWVENLNYSAKRLTQVWPGRFKTIAAATPFAHNPQALAEKTYGGRMGNNRPGDGYKYRGRFPLQATGGDMYRKASRALKLPALFDDPDSLVDDYLTGFRVSAWIYAVEKGCNPLADKRQFKAITIKINGGVNGLEDRIAYYERALRILPDNFKLAEDVGRPAEDDEAPDYIEQDESQEDTEAPNDTTVPKELGDFEKGVTTNSEKPADETAGSQPPAPAVEVKASQSSLISKITAFSMPAGAVTGIGAVWTFAQNIPPWVWAVLGGVAVVGMVLGAWLWNESQKRAQSRTEIVLAAAADKNKNNLRLI